MDRRRSAPHRGLVVAGVVGLVLGCTAKPPTPTPTPTPTAAPTPAPESEPLHVDPALDRIAELALDRGGCELPCPSDLTLIDDEGEVWYWGRAESERLGVHTGWVSRARVGLVAASLVDSGYVGLYDYYRASLSHARTLISGAVVDGVRTVVADRGHEAPEPAQRLIDGIVDLLEHSRWDPGPLEVGPGAARAPACLALVDRVAESCERLVLGEAPSARCRLFLSPAVAAGAGALPPEYCAALVVAHDRAPPPPIPGPRPRRGPSCAAYLRDLARGCVDELRLAPVDADTYCFAALHVMSTLSSAPDEEPEFDEIRIRADDYWCSRWARSHDREEEP